MCAVIGAIIRSPSLDQLNSVKRVFIESKIRGMHATGLSFVKNSSIHTIKAPLDAEAFPFDFLSYLNEDGNLYLIGHCRYSTSDLEYNQPMANDSKSIAHNGVITQEHPSKWENLYGYKCHTKNDSELILQTIESCESPLHRWQNSSLAVVELYADKKIRLYRNGKRPIYYTKIPNGWIVTSTKDIPIRAGIVGKTNQANVNTYITINQQPEPNFKIENIPFSLDLQHEIY